MRILLLGDLHGNRPATQALDEALKDIPRDVTWFLGDAVGKGPSSVFTCDWVREHCDHWIGGNWDYGIGGQEFPEDGYYWNQLGPERMAWLNGLPREAELTLAGVRFRLFHGRPTMPEPLYVHSEYEVLEPYFAPDYDVVGYADVHRQGMRVLGFKGLLFNTGSVGNGLGVAMAQYAILRGDWNSRELSPLDVTMVTVPYDRQQAIRDAQEAGERGLVNADLFCKEIETGHYARAQGKRSPL